MKSLSAYVWIFMVIAGMLTIGGFNLAAAESRDGVFIHLTQGKEDPHRVLMALDMALTMSEDHDVLVYFDIKAVEVALRPVFIRSRT